MLHCFKTGEEITGILVVRYMFLFSTIVFVEWFMKNG